MAQALISRRGGGAGGLEFNNLVLPLGEFDHRTSSLYEATRGSKAAAANDLVLIIGGISSASYPYSYTTKSGNYQVSTGVMTHGIGSERACHAIASTENYIVYGGGERSGAPSGIVQRHNSVTNARETLASLYDPTSSLAAGGCDGKVLFGGGHASYGYSSSVVQYDVVSGTKTKLSNLQVVKENLAAAGADGRIAFAGGWTTDVDSEVNHLDTYNVQTGARSSFNSLSGDRHSLSSAASDGYMVFSGGMTSSGTNAIYHTTCDIIKPTTFAITRLSLSNHPISTAATEGSVLFSAQPYVKYDLHTGTFTSVSSGSNIPVHLAAAAIGNNFVFASNDSVYGFGRSASVDIFDFELQGAATMTAEVLLTTTSMDGTKKRLFQSNQITIPDPFTGTIKYKNGVISI